MSSRAQIILDLVTKDKKNDTIRGKGIVENLNYENNIMVKTTPVIEEPERNFNKGIYYSVLLFVVNYVFFK